MSPDIRDIDVSVVIVSYNTAHLIGVCLESVLAIPGWKKEIIVVDNLSSDSSIEVIREKGHGIHLIENRENRGFGAANNQALPMCRGRYIFFLNPDTVVHPDTMTGVIPFMDARPTVGLCGTRLVNPDGTPQESVSCHYLGQKYNPRLFRGLKGPIAWVMGACMIARSEVIREVGGFDEDFFLYGEEEDLCLRIRRAGYEIGFVDTAVVTHIGGQSERTPSSSDVWRKKLLAEYVFYRKHYTPETIRRITRDHRLKSLWRIATLRLTFPFFGDKEQATAKLVKYRTIRDTLKEIEALPAFREK